MTRALGHKLLSEYGVITTPAVASQRLQGQDVCLIIATDGVWEVGQGGGWGQGTLATRLVGGDLGEGPGAVCWAKPVL